MLLSTSSQYAIIGILRLSRLPSEGFCRVDELIKGTHAPRHAVAKVFYELSKRRILESVRGIGGGYRPCANIADLTLMDVVEAVDGPYDPAALTDRGLCAHEQDCPLEALLQPVSDRLEQILRTTRIGDLAALYPHRACCAVTDEAPKTLTHPASVDRPLAGEEVRHEHEPT
jgi:Rrf2 family iron-sulfur cluster assembly transcriptional regulator